VLDKVELLVAGGDPEILAVVGKVVALLLALVVGEGHTAFFAEGRIGQHIVDAQAGIGHQGVGRRDKGIAVEVTDVVEKEVHQRQAAGAGDDLVAGEGLVFEELFLILAQAVMLR